jgi:hypothetical protein
MWCTIINGGLLLFWTLMCVLVPDLAYRLQYRFFPISRDVFNVVIYAFLGLFKILFILLNVVPYVALLIAA